MRVITGRIDSYKKEQPSYGRQGYTSFNNFNSKIHIFKTGVPQGGVLSPSLFNLYLCDIPTPTNPLINITGYADDIAITATHTNYRTAETILQPYLSSIINWATCNNFISNNNKTQTPLFTPNPPVYSESLSLNKNDNILATIFFKKIPSFILNPKLTFAENIKYTKTKE